VQVLAARPDLKVESIRGNVPTRLEKLATQNYDALVLAAAGLHRLGLQNRITEYLPVDVATPAPGQGAMAIEVRAGDGELGAIVAKCSHAQTAAAVGAERAFSAAVGGGCKQPVGAYATCDGDALTLVGMMVNNSGAIVRSTLTGKTADAASIGKNLAAQLVENAGR
jgi:hydroxymethylbilane synthase